MSHQYRIHFNTRSDRIRKDGTAPIYLDIRLNGERLKLQTGVFAVPSSFHPTTGHIDGIPTELARTYAARLMTLRVKAEKIFTQAIIEDLSLTRASFLASFTDTDHRTQSFTHFMAREIDAERPRKAPGTIKNYQKIYRSFTAFRTQLSFAELTPDLIDKYDKYLHGKGYAVNTIADHHKIVKRFCMAAMHRGFLEQNPYRQHRIRHQRTERVYLESAELHQMIARYQDPAIHPAEREKIRIFLFMCFTGMRYQDVRTLSWSNIQTSRIQFQPKKTARIRAGHSIPINDPIKKLMGPRHAKGKIFDTVSHQKMNAYLKDLCDRLSLDKSVTCHSGRHTFATQFLQVGGRVEVLQQILGHADLKTTQVYVHLADGRPAADMALMADLL